MPKSKTEFGKKKINKTDFIGPYNKPCCSVANLKNVSHEAMSRVLLPTLEKFQSSHKHMHINQFLSV